MSISAHFILGTHAHIASGASDSTFEGLYQARIKPFIVALYRYPKIQACVHYSGVLLHRIERAHPELFMLLEDIVARKQVELLGGGFYEPMLSLLPLQDKIGQIELLTTYLRKRFGKRPQGCRLPALAWEQNLVGPLNTCGMAYTFLDETQFRSAGMGGKGPCLAEDQGKLITVFPVASALSAALTGENAETALEASLSSVDTPILTVFPEGNDLSLNVFFDMLSHFESRLDFTTPGRLLKSLGALPKAYFPCSSARFEGVPRQSLITYPEANGLYAKMMFTHVLINQLRGDKARKHAAREELWKAQGYDVFYPLADGGIYQPAVRKAAYKSLLNAEKITRENGFTPSLMSFDFDMDGDKEFLFQDDQLNCYVQLLGASLFELDYLPKSWNYLDTFSTGARRTAFSDRLALPGVNSDTLHQSASRFLGAERFELAEFNRERGLLRFHLPTRDNAPMFGAITVDKTYRLEENALSLRYVLTNEGSDACQMVFIPVIDLSFSGDGESCLRLSTLTADAPVSAAPDHADIQQANGLRFQDIRNEAVLNLTFERACDVSLRSVKTGSPEAACYQSTAVMPLMPLTLAPRARFETELRLWIRGATPQNKA
ncbi:MAG: DUF1926 domain-containing protein [Treponema sp.]|jgi:hypothetical protein|nr:DUF1926 domain-containing protein [Treponema sp.]